MSSAFLRFVDPVSHDDYAELCFYTLAHRDPALIHQHVVDAFTAQSATEATKPIAITFALVGLYLHVEHDFSGRRVQQVHMQIAQNRSPSWPEIALPRERGSITVRDVIAAPAGPPRDHAIDDWCASVWHSYRASREVIAAFLRHHAII